MPSFFSEEKIPNPKVKKKRLGLRKGRRVSSEVSFICPCIISAPNAITFDI